MNFSEILRNQKEFNEKVIGKAIEELSPEERMHWIKEYSICLNSEILELLRESGNWKVHRKEKINVVQSNVLEELIDVFKYFLSIMAMHGFSEDDLEFGYKQKSDVVEQRWSQEHKQLNNIAVVDIDGTIGDYVKQFIDFVERRTGMNQVPPELVSCDIYASLAKVVGWDMIIKLKHEFRVCGEKRCLPVMDGAKEFLDALKKSNHDIVMLTARPFGKYKRILWDTIFWLKSNGLKFDAVLSSEDKYSELVKHIGSIRFAVEDDLAQAKNISMLGVPVYLVDRRYNKCSDRDLDGLKITRVDSFKEILEKENEK